MGRAAIMNTVTCITNHVTACIIPPGEVRSQGRCRPPAPTSIQWSTKLVWTAAVMLNLALGIYL